jgi:hypothetical protein
MSSTLPTNKIRQNSPSHFMTVSSLQGLVYAYNATAGQNTFTNATWASVGAAYSAVGSPYVSSINSAGGLLKDIGKSVVSSNRYFRKVQLVVRNGGAFPSTGASTFGVAGTALGTNPNQDYLTGYIELGYEGGGVPAPVVQFGTA